MTRRRGAILALVLGAATAGVVGSTSMQSDSHDKAVAIGDAPVASAPASNAQQTNLQNLDVERGTGDDIARPAAALAPDGGALPDTETLQALGAVVVEPGDVPAGSIPPVEVRLAQARGAIAGFADTVQRLEAERREAQETGVSDTSSLERRLAATSRNLELARFAERANEAELEGHPL